MIDVQSRVDGVRVLRRTASKRICHAFAPKPIRESLFAVKGATARVALYIRTSYAPNDSPKDA